MIKSKKAFTLVELIVVITILAILATISFISFSGFSQNSRNASRANDVKTVAKSLSLFHTQNSYYPDPDGAEIISYSGETVVHQGIFGESTHKEVGRISNVPFDPLTNTEYIYSLNNSKTEYEILTIYEGEIVKGNILNNTYADETYKPKVSGTYNKIFVKTSNYYIPLPSIIISEDLTGGIDLQTETSTIDSFVVTNGDNLPQIGDKVNAQTGSLDINLSVYSGSIDSNSSDADKESLAQTIQGAYSGTTLSNTSTYSTLLSKTTTEELVALVDTVVLGTASYTVASSGGGNPSCATNPGYSNTTYTEGSPTQENESWQNTNNGNPCYYECTGGYTGIDCSTPPAIVTCKSLYDGGTTVSDTYTINPTGSRSFDVYCNMDDNGGGWTLIAYHTDTTGTRIERSPVTTVQTGVLGNQDWLDVKGAISDGFMGIDEHGNISVLTKATWDVGSCVGLADVNSLVTLPAPGVEGKIYMNDSGCDDSGSDYSDIMIRNVIGNYSSALYNHTSAFSIWPYGGAYSYNNQSEMYYYVK